MNINNGFFHNSDELRKILAPDIITNNDTVDEVLERAKILIESGLSANTTYVTKGVLVYYYDTNLIRLTYYYNPTNKKYLELIQGLLELGFNPEYIIEETNEDKRAKILLLNQGKTYTALHVAINNIKLNLVELYFKDIYRRNVKLDSRLLTELLVLADKAYNYGLLRKHCNNQDLEDAIQILSILLKNGAKSPQYFAYSFDRNRKIFLYEELFKNSIRLIIGFRYLIRLSQIYKKNLGGKLFYIAYISQFIWDINEKLFNQKQMINKLYQIKTIAFDLSEKTGLTSGDYISEFHQLIFDIVFTCNNNI